MGADIGEAGKDEGRKQVARGVTRDARRAFIANLALKVRVTELGLQSTEEILTVVEIRVKYSF